MTNLEMNCDSSGFMGALVWDFGTFKIPHELMLSYDGMNNQPLYLANIDFSSAKFSSVGSVFFPWVAQAIS